MYYSYHGLNQSLCRRFKISLLVVAALPISIFTTGCATRATQASALPHAPAVTVPDADEKAADEKIAYYAKMQQKVEAQVKKRYDQEAAQTAQAEKKGVTIGAPGSEQGDIAPDGSEKSHLSPADAQAWAAASDSQRVDEEGLREQQVSMNSAGRIQPNWDSLSLQISIDQNAVELLKLEGRISSDVYTKTSSVISNSSQQLAEQQSSSEATRPWLFPGSN